MKAYYSGTEVRKDCLCCKRCTQIRMMASFGQNSLKRLEAGEFRLLPRDQDCDCPGCVKLDEKEEKN